MSYSFEKNKQGELISLVAWNYPSFLKALNEAIESGYEIDVSSPYNDHFEYKFAVYLRKRDVVDEKQIKQALLAYAKVLDPTTNGQKYKTVDSLLEKINEPTKD